MKKLLGIITIVLLFLANVDANERDNELNNLFIELKNSDSSRAIKIENKIWRIWSTHPSNNDKGLNLTKLLAQGSFLMSGKELNKAYEIFSQIILTDPNWSEAWNKRATVLYLMNQYQSSLDDIKVTLALEPRHFGALSGRALNYIELEEYEKAIQSYRAAQKIYPALDSAKKMIPELEALINDQAI